MLVLNIPVSERYDEDSQTFFKVTEPVAFEHSLLSLSKWEAKYEKPFLSDKFEKTEEELLDYLRMMVVNPAVTDGRLAQLTQDNIIELNQYISSQQTATWFNEIKKSSGPSQETVTAELIYYWMISYQIPMECQTWHLNRLLTLIRVFNTKQQKPEKMSKRDIMSRNRALNEQRKAKYKTKG